jgi:fermentation-respiration switch protein FrsA (DUF1100 family)
MAHGYAGVKEQYLDNFARPFAAAGFVVLVFDYRFLGASEGEPRQQVLWFEQLRDYRNAITWLALQPGVDAQRIGAWGSSYSGGHVLQLAAFDRRVRAVVAQVPAVSTWDAYFAALPAAQVEQLSAWHALARAQQMTRGEVAYAPVVAPPGQSAVMPQPEAFEWVSRSQAVAPRFENRVTVESLEFGMSYDPTQYIHLIAPTPLLMLIADEDIVTPTPHQRAAFARAREPKSLVVVPGRHFDPYEGPRHRDYLEPELEWFRRHLNPG